MQNRSHANASSADPALLSKHSADRAAQAGHANPGADPDTDRSPVSGDRELSSANGKSSPWAVRTLLFWLVLACLLPGVIGAVMLFANQYQEGRTQQERDTMRTVRALSQALDSHLLRGQAVAQALATRDALARRDFGHFHAGAKELLRVNGLGANIVLRDRSGLPLLNTRVPYGDPLPGPSPERVEAVFATGRPVISDLFIGDVTKTPLMSVNVPVIIDDKITYSLSIGILPEQFNQMLVAQKLPAGWVASMYDSKGTIVGRNVTPEKFIGNQVTRSLREALATSQQGAINSTTQEGTPVLTFFHRSPDTNWGVAIGIPRHILQATLLERLSQLAIGVTALFGLGLMLAWYMGGRIADSVRALIAPAIALGKGGSVPIPRVHVREAAEVAAGISRAAQLQQERAAVLQKQDEALRQSEANARQAASEAEARRQQLDSVLEATPVGIVVADRDGAVLHANAANRQLWGEHRLANHAREYGNWRGWWADHSERHGQPVQSKEWPMARALHGEDVAGDFVEIEPFDAPTVRRVVLVSAAPIRNQHNDIIGAVTAQMDITDRVCAEEALRQADRRKDEFLAMLAHELRNPLAPISAAAGLLDLGELDQARVRQVSAIISRQVKHMTGLVDDLLDVSRVTRGLVKLEVRRLDARTIIADAVEQARPMAESKRQQLIVHAPTDPAFVMGDQKRLVQVVTNLLNNAAKFTPPGGSIVLDVSATSEQIAIAVADNGIGMAPELVKRAFQLFAQGDRSLDRSQGGLGIGLALVRSLVELHGGKADAYSEGIGKGSRFTIRLPLVAAPDQAASTESGGGAVNIGSVARKVLIVDDNVDAAQMLAMLVESLGHQVLVEYGSCAALECAARERPDACLLDIGLPEMDGNELARRLRANPATRGAILVAVTGYGQGSEREQALAAGFDHHLVKPVDLPRLEAILGGASTIKA